MCLQLLTAPPFPQEKSMHHTSCQSRYLEFRHREIRLFVLSPETSDPRVSDDVHWWHPGVLRERKGETQYCYPSHNFTWRELVAKQFYTNQTRCLIKMNTSDTPFKMMEHARGRGNTAPLEPIMEVGYSVTIVAVLPRQMRSTYRHAESLSIVAIQFV